MKKKLMVEERLKEKCSLQTKEIYPDARRQKAV